MTESCPPSPAGVAGDDGRGRHGRVHWPPPARRRPPRRPSPRQRAPSPAVVLAHSLGSVVIRCRGRPGGGRRFDDDPGRAGGRRAPGCCPPRRQLTVPSGWTARVWARVDDARMEAWTPEGDLLVSSPGDGSVMELRPDRGGHRDGDDPAAPGSPIRRAWRSPGSTAGGCSTSRSRIRSTATRGGPPGSAAPAR